MAYWVLMLFPCYLSGSNNNANNDGEGTARKKNSWFICYFDLFYFNFPLGLVIRVHAPRVKNQINFSFLWVSEM